MNRALPLLALVALPLTGCDPEFVPGSVLDGLRILAVAPAPADVAPGETVTLRALDYAPAAEGAITRSWTFCPLTAGPSTAYRCLCELELPETGATATADPYALALQCLGDTLPPDAGALPPQVETVFRYTARTAAGERTAVARVPLFTSAASVPADRNLPPVITAVRLGATAGRPGDSIPVEVDVDPASLQTYVDGTGRTITEQVTVFFYTTAGRFPDGEDLDTAPLARTRLELRELRETDVQADVYVVVRDLRGGQAFDGPFTLAIDRSP